MFTTFSVILFYILIYTGHNLFICIFQESPRLYSLKLSHNEFREQGGIKIGKALGVYSWRFIRLV